jgi:type VI secretion system secreted protein VgrG
MPDDHQTYGLLLEAHEGGLDQLSPVELHVEEALSRPFLATLLARTLDPTDPGSIDPGTWLRKKMAVGVARGRDPSWFHGVVVATEHIGEDHNQHQIYRLELAPSLVLLKHTRRTRIFTDMKPVEVVQSVLSEGPVTPVDLKAAGAAGQPMRHITQYEESDFDFVSRLLEQEGAAYWFTHTKSNHTLVIGDSTTHYPGSSAVITAPFAAASDAENGGKGVIKELARRFEIVAKESLVRDYSESHPKSAALGQKTVVANNAPGSGGKRHEADYHVTQTDGDATTYATRASDGLMNRSCRLVGESSVTAFRAGSRIAVEGKEDYADHALIIEITHVFKDDVYSNRFSAMPVNRLPWRPQRSTPIPRIDGVIPAVVTATAGDQGAGEDGAYRVTLLNCEAPQDRIIRMAQPYAGPAQGFHFPLPVNTEVLLSHEYGHPDRPIIAGSMHNVEDPSPVKEANKTQCVMKSAAGASLIFEDKQDEEKVTLESKNKHTLVLNDMDKKVLLASEKLNKLELDDDAEVLTLHAVKDHKVQVDGKSDTKVVGKKTVDCDDEVSITAANKITLSVGGNSITISTSKIEISCSGNIEISSSGGDLKGTGVNVTISANASAKISGNASAELSAAGQTTVKGAMVMIN